MTPWCDGMVDDALAEDVGSGDRTTEWTVSESARARGEIVARESMVVAGAEMARAVFRRLDPALRTVQSRADGEALVEGEVLLTVEGPTRGILTGERTALNFLGRLSGIATHTRRFVEEVKGMGVRIVDTRKTTPGWRLLEKEAVRAGGGDNHRSGLYDMVLIKENHIQAAGGVSAALARVQERNRVGLPVEVEVTDLGGLEEAFGHRPDRILLDNMDPPELEKAVRWVRSQDGPHPLLEASGGMSLSRVRAVAETGVDLISVGALTHSAPAADLSLRIVDEGPDG